MNKNQEIIKPLKEIVNRVEYYDGYTLIKDDLKVINESINALQTLVDRDEPKRVNHLHPLKAFGKCPSCNKSIHILHHRQFCGECGTRLEWRKDE